MIAFPTERAAEIAALAIAEDCGVRGDVTSEATLPDPCTARADLVARERLLVAGLPICELVFASAARRLSRPMPEISLRAREGAVVEAGMVLARIEGDARVILLGERTMLNLIARLSGIATMTAAAVSEIAGTRARIADTRKTTPLLRSLEKYAVALAGGENHRATLDELILAKDNHKLLAGGMEQLIDNLRRSGTRLAEVEIEVETVREFEIALAAGAGFILLDNMSVDEVRSCAELAQGRTRLEVSGGLRPGNLRDYALTGVDRLSLGSLTHGARAVDVALDIALPAGD